LAASTGWSTTRAGPLDTKKRIYGQAFTVYALAEYYHATGDAEILASALRLVEVIDAAGHDDRTAATLRPTSGTGRWPWISA
jgi:mannose/cellobiose epimerase-like protein (N-acyl-D-glucosamine 2-epimerase family)